MVESVQMLRRRNVFACVFLLHIILLIGCQSQHLDEQPVYPIKGLVKVDGTPGSLVQVTLHHPDSEMTGKPTFPLGFTGENGEVKISTYADGDGAPAGNYNETFTLKEFDVLSRTFAGPDKLKEVC